jgi:N-formylglutamate amidohydrolase
VSDPFIVIEGDGPIVATAIHDGHALRDECTACIAVDDATRLREEDPFTGRIAAVAPTHVIVNRSRFEVDLNRPRASAVYRCAADAWGLEVWSTPPSERFVDSSLALYDRFYRRLEGILREHERKYGRFVVLDIHSYNHRRDGADGAVADPAGNPEINIGTGSLDRSRWGGIVERFCRELSAAPSLGRTLDVRENVKFKGGELSKWVHRTFPTTGCCLAVEFKKTFMNEWTGELDTAHLDGLAAAVATTLPGLVESVTR